MDFSALAIDFYAKIGQEDGTVENTVLAGWFNEAIKDLALEMGTVTGATYTAVANVAVTGPSDAYKIVSVRDSDGYDYYAFSFDPLGNMYFEDDDTYTVYYIVSPTLLTGLVTNAEPDIDAELHYLIPMYAASTYWAVESEGDAEELMMAKDWWQRYQYGKLEMLRKRTAKQRRTRPRRWVVIE
jgi:hypothetical protein